MPLAGYPSRRWPFPHGPEGRLATLGAGTVRAECQPSNGVSSVQAYIWTKTAHLVFVIAWMAAVFYLPRILVNLAEAGGDPGVRARLVLMGRRLYRFGHVMFGLRSEEHTSELQSLMRISYAVFCLKKKKHKYT